MKQLKERKREKTTWTGGSHVERVSTFLGAFLLYYIVVMIVTTLVIRFSRHVIRDMLLVGVEI
jgi:hypothetical protein